jgi:predicted nucleic acid-binding protein
MLTDTTFWLDLVEERRARRRGPAHAFLAAHRLHELRVSIVTWEELAEGFEASAEVEAILHRVKVLLFSKQVAWETSRIQRELPQRLGENDSWIAGTARAWGMRLVSRDAAFRRVQRLVVATY